MQKTVLILFIFVSSCSPTLVPRKKTEDPPIPQQWGVSVICPGVSTTGASTSSSCLNFEGTYDTTSSERALYEIEESPAFTTSNASKVAFMIPLNSSRLTVKSSNRQITDPAESYFMALMEAQQQLRAAGQPDVCTKIGANYCAGDPTQCFTNALAAPPPVLLDLAHNYGERTRAYLPGYKNYTHVIVIPDLIGFCQNNCIYGNNSGQCYYVGQLPYIPIPTTPGEVVGTF